MKIREYKADIIDVTLTLSDLKEMIDNRPYQAMCPNSGKELRIWIVKNKDNKKDKSSK